MVVLGAGLLLLAFVLGIWSVYNFWRRPGAAFVALMSAVVALGGAWTLLHVIGQKGF